MAPGFFDPEDVVQNPFNAEAIAQPAGQPPQVPPQAPAVPAQAGVPVQAPPPPPRRHGDHIVVAVHVDDVGVAVETLPDDLRELLPDPPLVVGRWAHYGAQLPHEQTRPVLEAFNRWLVATCRHPALAALAPGERRIRHAIVLVPLADAALACRLPVARLAPGRAPRAALVAHHLVGRVLAADLRVQPPLRLEPNHRRPQPDTAALRVWPTSAAAAADLLVVAAMLGLGFDRDPLPNGVTVIWLGTNGVAVNWAAAQQQLHVELHGRLGYIPFSAPARGGGSVRAVPTHLLGGPLPDAYLDHEVRTVASRDQDGVPIPPPQQQHPRPGAKRA